MKRIAITVLTLAISAVVGSSFAGAQDYGNDRHDHGYNDARSLHTDRAQVLSVEQVGNPYGQSTYERVECWNERINGYEGGYYRDSEGRLYRGDHHDNTNGMIIGALIGGALGNTVGKGDGRTAATIGGAVIGGAIGAHAGDHNDYEYRDNGGVVRRCRTVVTTDNNGPGGYNVTYTYAGQTYRAFTTQRPGRWIRVTVDVRPDDRGGDYRH
jgi:uncharacterized protein YcfJ